MFLLALLLGCGGPAPTEAPATPVASPVATPAAPAEVGPDGPGDVPAPTFTMPTDGDAAIARGKATFEAKGCPACHQFGGVLVGPDLTGLGDRRTDVWIAKMIRHPDAMTKKDPSAKALLAKHMVQMPDQGVPDADLGDLITFLKSSH